MRDIREDLRHRLTAVAAQRGQMQARLSWLDKVEDQIKGLLEYERMLHSDTDQAALALEDPAVNESERSQLSQFLRAALADFRTHTLDDLKKLAEKLGVNFEGKNPGRVIHFALLGMAQSGIVEMVEKGTWRMQSNPQAANGFHKVDIANAEVPGPSI